MSHKRKTRVSINHVNTRGIETQTFHTRACEIRIPTKNLYLNVRPVLVRTTFFFVPPFYILTM